MKPRKSEPQRADNRAKKLRSFGYTYIATGIRCTDAVYELHVACEVIHVKCIKRGLFKLSEINVRINFMCSVII